MSITRIPELDGLRALFVLWVIIAHNGQDVMDLTQVGWLANHAMAGFFTLSGFLITRQLMVSQDTPLFYKRRLARIIPPAFLAIVASGVIAKLADDQAWLGLWWSLTFNIDLLRMIGHDAPPGLGGFWSLGIEEKFYLVWPLIFVYAAKRRADVLMWLIAVPLIFAALYNIWAPPNIGWNLTYHAAWARVPSLAIGCLFALHEEWLRERVGGCWVYVLALLGIGAGLQTCGGLAHNATAMYQTTMLGAGMVLGGLCLHWLGNTLGQLLSARPVTFIGMISYGLYVYDGPVGLLTHDMHATPQVRFIVHLAAVLAVSIISFYAVEEPIRRWAKSTKKGG